MTTLAEFMIVASAENHPPMLDKSMYNSWESRMFPYIKGKKNSRMMLESIDNGPLVYPTVKEDGQIRKKKYVELTEQEQLQDDRESAKGIWERVKLLMKGTELSYQERECKLYNEFDKFTSVKEHLPIQETKLLFKTTELLFNKFKGDKVRVLLGKGHMARQCTQPKRPRNAAWFKEKMLLAQAQESGQVLDEEQLVFLADPGITDCHDIQPTIIHNAAFQTGDIDAYDSDCDDISSAKAVLMANLSSYGSDVLYEVPQHDTYQHDNMLNQSVQETPYFEQPLIDYVRDNEITSDSNIISYEQYLQQTQNASVQDTNSFA
ncbi:hypothetical protein Tco_1338972, partial [Tanacetum coccineum]